MKGLLAHAFAALVLIVLIAAPAAAAEPSQCAVTKPAATQPDSPNEPVEMQVPPTVPSQGFSCVLPPQQQQDFCICPLVFAPVCGCNGQTYSNSCFASCEVRSWEEGECA